MRNTKGQLVIVSRPIAPNPVVNIQPNPVPALNQPTVPAKTAQILPVIPKGSQSKASPKSMFYKIIAIARVLDHEVLNKETS